MTKSAPYCSGLIADSTTAYWSPGPDLRKWQLGSADVSIVSEGGQDLALTSSYVYGTARSASGYVWRVLRTGGSIETIAPSHSYATNIVATESGASRSSR